MFVTKTDRNSVSPGCHRHIIDRQYIMAPYMSFYGFKKKSNFHAKPIRVRLRFYRKSPICGKNRPKLYISWSWLPYYRSAIHNGPVYEFLWILKHSNFRAKSIRVSLWFYRKSPICGKNRPKLHISWLWLPYYRSAIHNGPVYEFLWILKNQIFAQNP
jgi:hypothetical protein